MELITLDSNFQPKGIVENYQSLIWTERFGAPGDFELTTTDIANTLAQMPNESVVSLRDSVVPMIVEWANIKKPKNNGPGITITGRSFEASALERRASVRGYMYATGAGIDRTSAPVDWVMHAASPSDAAFRVIREIIADEAKYAYDGNNPVVLQAHTIASNLYDAIPDISLTLPLDYKVVNWDATTTFTYKDVVASSGKHYVAKNITGNLNKTPASNATYWTEIAASATGLTYAAAKSYSIPKGQLYLTVMDLLKNNNHGIKATRPDPSRTKILVEIYQSLIRPDVAIDATLGLIDDATYLLSKQGSVTVGYSDSPDRGTITPKTVGAETVSGLTRRVLYMDYSSDNTLIGTSAEAIKLRENKALIDLYEYNATALFGGEVAAQVARGFNKTYFLGDILTMFGDYGLSQNVRVAEFIRSVDSSGEKAYPTFEAVT